MGAFAGAAYTTKEARLGKHAVLVLYTDGVTEARRTACLYGDERLLEGLTKLRAHRPYRCCRRHSSTTCSSSPAAA